MNYFFSILNFAYLDFKRNKVRTFLTSLGILIGVASVVLLIAFGLGLKQYIKNQFESLGTNLIIVTPGQILQGGSFSQSSGAGAVGGVKFDEKDMVNLKKAKSLKYISPVFLKNTEISYAGELEMGELFATTEDIFKTWNLEIDEGHVFRKSDVIKRSKVVVMGPKIAGKLFSSPSTALGKKIKIESQTYKVIGVLESKGGGSIGRDFDSFVYMPYKAAFSFNPDKTFFAMYIKSISDENVEEAKEDINNILLKRYEEDDFSVLESTEIMEAVNSIFAMLNTILVLIGAISLLVGGIGIMNIMYVSVVERTKEVGIRRAVGATRSDILYQFLSEAVILSLVGGLGGVLVASVVVLIVRNFFPAVISIFSVIVAFVVSSGIGVLFGVFPARKASDLSPIDAIRYE